MRRIGLLLLAAALSIGALLALSGPASAGDAPPLTVNGQTAVGTVGLPTGSGFTIGGSDCTAINSNPASVEVQVTATGASTSVFTGAASLQESGDWTISVPALAAGGYEVLATCDRYLDGYSYHPLELLVSAPTCATSCSPPPPSSTPTTASGKLADGSLSPGGSLQVTGQGFQPGEHVQIVLHSQPVQLGVLTANSAGDISGTFTIPAGMATGAHEIVMTGQTSGRVVTLALQLSLAPSTTTPTTPAVPTVALASTGFPTVPITAVAALMLVLGLLATVGSRRRYPAAHRAAR